MPTTVKGRESTSRPSSRKWRLTLSHAPRAVMPERLVVVALRTARGERVAEPEAVLDRDRVGRVRERRGALVGGHDEVRVVLVEGAHARGTHDLAADDVVGHVEHAADQRRVAQPHLLAQRVAIGRRVAQDEPALGAHGHDHRVLDHLGLHQAEHLGAVVLAAVGPADPAARHVPAAQVDALDLRVVDEDLEERRGPGHLRDVGRAQLEREIVAAERRVRAHGGVDQRGEAAQDAVLVEAADGAELLLQLRAQLRLALLARVVAEARAEELDELARRLRMGAEDVVLVRGGERRRDDPAVAPVGAQDRDVVVVEARADDQRVERVGLAAPAPDRADRRGEARAVALAIELRVVDEDAEVVQVGAVVAAVEPRRHLLDDRQAERLEHGQQLAQRDLAAVRRDRHARQRPRARPACARARSFWRPTANGSPAATRSSSSMSWSASSGEVAVL